jgi:hypothetical protein
MSLSGMMLTFDLQVPAIFAMVPLIELTFRLGLWMTMTRLGGAFGELLASDVLSDSARRVASSTNGE